MDLKRKSTWQKPGLTAYILSCEFLKKNITKKEYKIRSMQWITVAKVEWNFFVFKTSLAGIMILYLLVMAQRPLLLMMALKPCPLGTNVETSKVESVMIVVSVFFK